jgi:hypothetical protein
MDAELSCFVRCGSDNASSGCTAADNNWFADEIGIFNTLNRDKEAVKI